MEIIRKVYSFQVSSKKKFVTLKNTLKKQNVCAILLIEQMFWTFFKGGGNRGIFGYGSGDDPDG